MPMHATPVTEPEKFAEYLEVTYGLQLDSARYKMLVEELTNFRNSGVPVIEVPPDPMPEPPPDYEPFGPPAEVPTE